MQIEPALEDEDRAQPCTEIFGTPQSPAASAQTCCMRVGKRKLCSTNVLTTNTTSLRAVGIVKTDISDPIQRDRALRVGRAGHTTYRYCQQDLFHRDLQMIIYVFTGCV